MTLPPVASAAAAPPERARGSAVAHALIVELDPRQGGILASDRLTLPEPAREVRFALHRDLQPELASAGRLEHIDTREHLRLYRVVLPDPSTRIALDYQGRIRHPPRERAEGMGRSRQQSLGTIAADGVFLQGHTGWYPRLMTGMDTGMDTGMETFTLDVRLPPGWSAISQGAGPLAVAPLDPSQAGARVRWQESQPQDEIYLIAAPFTLYRQAADGVERQVWLRQKDDTLAQRYLDATQLYLERYSALLGDYPYAKFALVENSWETGYGMPSFTLLGPRVLRLPFILHSSYPHEILHNWWGNSVFVDWESGNWSEGLTAYLADHLNQALQGRGAAYRHDQLKGYADYVRAASDFPLDSFRVRHDQASQAIGYGKALMLFHMLRRYLGDERFVAGLRRFYADNRFRAASWADLQRAFERVSGRELDSFLGAWVQRPGAIRLALRDVRSRPTTDGRHVVSGKVAQVQSAAPFPLMVPVVLHDARGQPHEQWLDFSRSREQAFTFTINEPPLRLAVDPLFDSFRWLEPGETPISLSTLLGAPRGTFILPARAAPALRRAYRQLAADWQRGHSGWRVIEDSAIPKDPDDPVWDGPVWLLGWENAFLPMLNDQAPALGIAPERKSLVLDGHRHRNQSPVLTHRLRATPAEPNSGQALGWLAADDPDTIAALARKVPHYGKYGYLTFSGEATTNALKGQWPVRDSPLIVWLDQRAEPRRQEARDGTSDPELTAIKRPSLLRSIPDWTPDSVRNSIQQGPRRAPSHSAAALQAN